MHVRSVGVGRVWDCILCTCVNEEGGDGEGESSEVPSLLSYTLRYVSLAELVHVCQFGLREPIHLCACVSEEGGDGEGAGSEAPSLLSYTLTTECRKRNVKKLNLQEKIFKKYQDLVINQSTSSTEETGCKRQVRMASRWLQK